ncbi:hypothetical protein EYF80_023528 [Liparis tanakae]|uniref:Uncharacterized protein n=1 Tax=Liparis tanakae TaxID=230148 RepID=A0A4Z2HMW7_9TELE|nr:hypothetical protein EYF80_023528 [Liparis tanakae]
MDTLSAVRGARAPISLGTIVRDAWRGVFAALSLGAWARRRKVQSKSNRAATKRPCSAAHLSQTEALALSEVQGSDPQADQTGEDQHQLLSGHRPVGDRMAPVSLQTTDYLETDAETSVCMVL